MVRPKNNETPRQNNGDEEAVMSEGARRLERLSEEFVRFERTVEELRFLKLVANDLKSFRKMIRLRKYD
ncbi:MAG: hypothetical protein RMJ15_02640 [Nitrososphaerota archaeon]|nr:hypothetical protein [Candidatus Bathyarchaeota archaeon]MDW8022628.1 hypothetical protein [Nitrososphaerota archaeon]